MTKKIKIVTDSTCTILNDDVENLDIHYVKLIVRIDGKEYLDDADSIDKEKYVEMMDNAKDLPQTSQPPIGELVKLYDELGADGSEIISIHLTELLSGTVNTAKQAAEMSSSNVTVVDSGFIDIALGFQVYLAAKLASEGASKEEIIAEMDKMKKHTKLFLAVSTLDNLVKSGRVNKIVGKLSSALNMKIVFEIKNAEFNIVSRGRGNKTFMKWLESMLEKYKTDEIACLGISYVGGKKISEELKSRIEAAMPNLNIPIIHTTPLIATHAGKDAFSIMFYTKY